MADLYQSIRAPALTSVVNRLSQSLSPMMAPAARVSVASCTRQGANSSAVRPTMLVASGVGKLVKTMNALGSPAVPSPHLMLRSPPAVTPRTGAIAEDRRLASSSWNVLGHRLGFVVAHDRSDIERFEKQIRGRSVLRL